MARMCTKCGEKYSEREVSELKSWGERMWFDPFICPDCYDSLRRNDLGDQAAELLDEKPPSRLGDHSAGNERRKSTNKLYTMKGEKINENHA